jgi:hypothetical protein
MSDYLWDKTGEPDAEVERLEALLGGFRSTPRPLALPAQVATFGRRRSWLFAPAGLAAAASLLLAFLAGAAFLLRPATQGKSVVASGTLRPQAGALGKTARRMLEPPPPPPDTPRGVVKDERVAFEIQRRGSRDMKGEPSASLPRRRQKPATSTRVGAPDGGAPVFEAMSAGSAGGGAPSFFESTRLMTKEQLVYALRLTGAKLRDVRLRTQGRDGLGPTQGGRTPLQ